MRRVAILQSNYIPWKGYFDIIQDVDVFVFHDDLQYTKGDWRNRNRIKTPQGLQWLTIPVGIDQHRRICDVTLPPGDWRTDHWQCIEAAYRGAPYFRRYAEYLKPWYHDTRWTHLSHWNQAFIAAICRDLLGIRTEFCHSSQFQLTERKSARVLELLERLGATDYISGPSARTYLREDDFLEAGIRVHWKDYSHYPEYSQLHPPFDHHVSILDVLFHTGPRAAWYVWQWRQSRALEAAA
jgi:hypothetical protein